jgi:uncharacterized membrane-anchored protein
VSGRDRAALVLIVIALVGAVFELFYRPFGIALPALIVTMVGISISDRYRRLGWYATLAITLAFLIGASFAVWDSRPLY